MQPVDWSGTRIRRDTVIYGRRYVLGAVDVPIPTDIREWVSCSESQEIRDALQDIKDLPQDHQRGSFDQRARLVWNYVTENVSYAGDEASQRKVDFWQFPAETLTLRHGDCEDCAVLLAALLMASGISPFCVRAVIGQLTQGVQKEGHTWPIYKDERGIWRILESTLRKAPRQMPAADRHASPAASPRYCPQLCFNQFHLWDIGSGKVQNVSRTVQRIAREPVGTLVLALR